MSTTATPVDTQALRAEYADVTKDSSKVYRDVLALLDAVERRLTKRVETAEARLAAVERERDDAVLLAERCRRDRADALNVRSRDGLLSSEWLARTGKAERERAAALERLAAVETVARELLGAHTAEAVKQTATGVIARARALLGLEEGR